jgi:pyrroline-5-carboxylate reductase
MKLGLVGCGFMGEAMLSATIARNVVDAPDVAVAEINDERCASVRGRYGVRATGEALEAVQGADIVILAVKPQEFDAAARAIGGKLHRDQTVMSIMAGVPTARIARDLTHASIARVMPSTPAAIGEAMSVWTATPEVDEPAKGQIASILQSMGREVYVEDEKYLDMATALSGSGPGFVYLLLEAFVDAGVHIGFKRNVAEMLALQTFIGSAKYAETAGKHLAQLRNEVTSPAGTTAAGLIAMENAGVRGAIIAAVEAAYERSKELGA